MPIQSESDSFADPDSRRRHLISRVSDALSELRNIAAQNPQIFCLSSAEVQGLLNLLSKALFHERQNTAFPSLDERDVVLSFDSGPTSQVVKALRNSSRQRNVRPSNDDVAQDKHDQSQRPQPVGNGKASQVEANSRKRRRVSGKQKTGQRMCSK